MYMVDKFGMPANHVNMCYAIIAMEAVCIIMSFLPTNNLFICSSFYAMYIHLFLGLLHQAPSSASKLSAASEKALSTITYVGCGISVAGLVTTLIFTVRDR